MSFNWDDHPVVKTGGTKKFNWNDHPVVKPEEGGFFSGKKWEDPADAINGHIKDALTNPETGGAILGGIGGGALAGPAGALLGSGAGAYLGNAGKNAYNHFVHPEEAPKTSMDYITDPMKAGADGVIAEGIGQGVVKGYHGLKNLKDNQVMKKVGKVIHGMPEDFTQHYLENKGELMSGPELNGSPTEARPSEQIMEDMQGYHDRSAKKITDSERNVQPAKEAVRDNSDAWKDKRQSLQDQHAEQKYQTSLQHGDASLKYSEAAQAQKENLQGVNVRNLVSPIQEAIKKLKDQVNHGSNESYVILGDHPGTVSIGPLKAQLRKGMEDLKLEGNVLTPTDQTSISELQKSLSMIENLPNEVRYPQAKFILQRLGEDTTYGQNVGAYGKIVDRVKKEARKVLDEMVKERVPAYRDAMKKVSYDTELLSQLSEKFGNPEHALSRLENLSSARGTNIDFELLKKLDQETKSNLVEPIVRYLKAQDTLKTPSRMNSLKQGLPEYGQKAATQAELKRLGDPKVKKAIRERLAKSNEAKVLNDSKANLLNKRLAVEQAEKAHEPFQPFSQRGVEGRYKALNGARHFNAEKQFSDLDRASGRNFSQEVTDRAILDAFERTDAQGSRKVNFAKTVGKFIGLVLGGGVLGGPIGAGMGATTGLAMDKYSGQTLRALLDARIGLAKGIEGLEGQFGKYAPILGKAAERGVKSLATTVYMLSRDEEFNKKLN